MLEVVFVCVICGVCVGVLCGRAGGQGKHFFLLLSKFLVAIFSFLGLVLFLFGVFLILKKPGAEKIAFFYPPFYP